jgi:hypothetical protein
MAVRDSMPGRIHALIQVPDYAASSPGPSASAGSKSTPSNGAGAAQADSSAGPVAGKLYVEALRMASNNGWTEVGAELLAVAKEHGKAAADAMAADLWEQISVKKQRAAA